LPYLTLDIVYGNIDERELGIETGLPMSIVLGGTNGQEKAMLFGRLLVECWKLLILTVI
jgi:hypothetical protein